MQSCSKDLRGPGKPLSFDGNDAEYQDLRFSFRLHMSLVSAVSQKLMDKREIERNPISLAAVRALGGAHFQCCMQTKGSVRTLVRSVEEQSIRARHAKSTICPDAEDHDACETMV